MNSSNNIFMKPLKFQHRHPCLSTLLVSSFLHKKGSQGTDDELSGRSGPFTIGQQLGVEILSLQNKKGISKLHNYLICPQQLWQILIPHYLSSILATLHHYILSICMAYHVVTFLQNIQNFHPTFMIPCS